MRRLYTFVLYLLIPFIVLRLYWKGRRLPLYRERIKERFAIKWPKGPVDVWLHAVSMGEVVAASPLIDELLAHSKTVLVTTMTPTGSEQVKKRFGTQVLHQYVPYDLPFILRRFFKQYQPKIGIIMETELWPNLIFEAKRMNMPLFLANARLSDKAFKQYQKVRFFIEPMLKQFTAILAQSTADAARFIDLGAAKEQVAVPGNIKFDLHIDVKNNQLADQLKTAWGKTRTVFIAASTHDDEEAQLLSRYAQLRAAIPDLVLLIAPRHPERFQAVYLLSKKLGLNTGLRSQLDSINEQTEVIILDSMGELLGFYQVADYAFVGGSLVPIGGHNVLEPIAMHLPVFTGLFMNNSKEIADELHNAKAILMVADIDALITAIIHMYQKPELRQNQIEAANVVMAANRGSLARHLERITAGF